MTVGPSQSIQATLRPTQIARSLHVLVSVRPKQGDESWISSTEPTLSRYRFESLQSNVDEIPLEIIDQMASLRVLFKVIGGFKVLF